MKLTKKVLKKIIAEEINKLEESSPQGFDQMAQMQPREYEAMTKSQPVTGKEDPRAEHLHVLADTAVDRAEQPVSVAVSAAAGAGAAERVARAAAVNSEEREQRSESDSCC